MFALPAVVLQNWSGGQPLMPVKLIVGLGNIDREYDGTRHNAGFAVVDQLGGNNDVQFKLVKDFSALLGKTAICGNGVLLAKPTTYMNNSGRAVLAILNYFKIDLCDLLVIHDDVSMPLGRLRLQQGGGAGGQHGVESILECFGGNKNFSRLKVGVGPDPGGARRASYVLARFPLAEAELVNKVVALSVEAAIIWLDRGIKEAMNIYNGINLAPPTAVEKTNAEKSPDNSNKIVDDDEDQGKKC